eukprot:GHVH01007228.1.p1 GENE.GHVH01007228.1~~GHVH01007228.1.p1  ORF type:complete len:956 (+),score=171.80 GHVH01007228.1:78-2945(+)
MSSRNRICTLYVHKKNLGPFPGIQGWKQELEKCQNKDLIRLKVLEEMLVWMGEGETEQVSKIVMSVIRFILPSEDNRIKKRLQLFWENCICTNPDGSLKEEMILVCDHIRKDLQSPNEFIRGSTCRMLCNINQMKILEPLLDAIRDNLENRHPYVVRNAIMCVYSILRLDPEAMPGVLDEIEALLHGAADDPSTMRNAFLMILELDPDRAVFYAQDVQNSIADMGDLFQMQYLNLLKKLCESESDKVNDYLSIVANLIEIATSPSVLYEGAMNILDRVRTSSASRVAVKTLIGLLESQGDSNVKQIVINQLTEISNTTDNSLFDPFLLDMLRIMSVSSYMIRTALTSIIVKMNNHSTKDLILNFTNKEILSVHEQTRTSEDDVKYLGVLLMINSSIYEKFPDCIYSSISLLCTLFKDDKYSSNFLDESKVNKDSSDRKSVAVYGLQRSVAFILRDVVVRSSGASNIAKDYIVDLIPSCRSAHVTRIFLWLIAHKLDDDSEACKKMIDIFYSLLSPLPFQKTLNDKENSPNPPKMNSWNLRNCVIECEDLLLSSLICICLAKFAIACSSHDGAVEKALEIVSNVYILYKQHSLLTDNSITKINASLRIILAIKKNDRSTAEKMMSSLLPKQRDEQVIEASIWKVFDKDHGAGDNIRIQKEKISKRICNPLTFRQLASTSDATPKIKHTEGVSDLDLAMFGPVNDDEGGLNFLRKLDQVNQMTGLGDPIYVESFFTVDAFDVTAEFLIINRTNMTVENLCLEISSGCDSMNFVSAPPMVTLAPMGTECITVSMKAKNTDTGLIFGYATYSTGTGANMSRKSLPLHDVHVDLLSGNNEVSCVDEATFRELWTLFEWENKIQVKSMTQDIHSFIDDVVDATKMTILGERMLNIVTENHLPFISQNLYCKTSFEEEALANVSLFKSSDGKMLEGHVRIRARKQGIALTIGDRVSSIHTVV